jgi:hypothetical protein
VEIIHALNIDTRPYDKFMSHEGIIARTIMLDRQLKGYFIIRKTRLQLFCKRVFLEKETYYYENYFLILNAPICG